VVVRKRRAPVVGRWYIPRTGSHVQTRKLVAPTPRWVLAVANLSVIYSAGGDVHYECSVLTFMRWVRKTRAISGKRKKGVIKWRGFSV